MSERSWFWGGQVTGDANNAAYMEGDGAPYTDKTYADILQRMHSFDRAKDGVLYHNPAGSPNLGAGGNDNLKVTAQAMIASIAPGYALVDGRIFFNSSASTYDFAGLADGSYQIVLRRGTVEQNVRSALLTGVAPLIFTQNDTYWDVPLARVTKAAGTLYVEDQRRFLYAGAGTSIELYHIAVGPWMQPNPDYGIFYFDPIPQCFRALRLVVGGRVGSVIQQQEPIFYGGAVRFNYDTAHYYTFESVADKNGADSKGIYDDINHVEFGAFAASGEPVGVLGYTDMVIYDYAIAAMRKTFYGHSWLAGDIGFVHKNFTGYWVGSNGNAAITAIDASSWIDGNGVLEPFITGSWATLYGIF